LNVAEDQKEAQEQVRQLNAELEQRVQDRTAQLKAANYELEAFSYPVSHNLRAPLRALDGFSSALLTDYQEILDDQEKNYLTRVQEASRRMGQFIEDLINLSRLSSGEVNLSCEDLSHLARQITDELIDQSPAKSVEFNISPDLIVHADPGLMKIPLRICFIMPLNIPVKRRWRLSRFVCLSTLALMGVSISLGITEQASMWPTPINSLHYSKLAWNS
jgi:light-regulated signal transduction histidine kinase (bacteriophytochrome)